MDGLNWVVFVIAQILVENENMSCPNPSWHDDFTHNLVIDDDPTEYKPNINKYKFKVISRYYFVRS